MEILFPQLSGSTEDSPSHMFENIYQKQTQGYKLLAAMYDRNSPEFTYVIPKVLIKGVPILDHDGNLVAHTFLATCTWELEIDGTPNANLESNKLQWAITVPTLKKYMRLVNKNNKLETETHHNIQHKLLPLESRL